MEAMVDRIFHEINQCRPWMRFYEPDYGWKAAMDYRKHADETLHLLPPTEIAFSKRISGTFIMRSTIRNRRLVFQNSAP